MVGQGHDAEFCCWAFIGAFASLLAVSVRPRPPHTSGHVPPRHGHILLHVGHILHPPFRRVWCSDTLDGVSEADEIDPCLVLRYAPSEALHGQDKKRARDVLHLIRASRSSCHLMRFAGSLIRTRRPDCLAQ